MAAGGTPFDKAARDTMAPAAEETARVDAGVGARAVTLAHSVLSFPFAVARALTRDPATASPAMRVVVGGVLLVVLFAAAVKWL